jgi:hypothetical protein
MATGFWMSWMTNQWEDTIFRHSLLHLSTYDRARAWLNIPFVIESLMNDLCQINHYSKQPYFPYVYRLWNYADRHLHSKWTQEKCNNSSNLSYVRYIWQFASPCLKVWSIGDRFSTCFLCRCTQKSREIGYEGLIIYTSFIPNFEYTKYSVFYFLFPENENKHFSNN